MAMLAILVPPLTYLGWTAVATIVPRGALYQAQIRSAAQDAAAGFISPANSPACT